MDDFACEEPWDRRKPEVHSLTTFKQTLFLQNFMEQVVPNHSEQTLVFHHYSICQFIEKQLIYLTILYCKLKKCSIIGGRK